MLWGPPFCGCCSRRHTIYWEIFFFGTVHSSMLCDDVTINRAPAALLFRSLLSSALIRRIILSRMQNGGWRRSPGLVISFDNNNTIKISFAIENYYKRRRRQLWNVWAAGVVILITTKYALPMTRASCIIVLWVWYLCLEGLCVH